MSFCGIEETGRMQDSGSRIQDAGCCGAGAVESVNIAHVGATKDKPLPADALQQIFTGLSHRILANFSSLSADSRRRFPSFDFRLRCDVYSLIFLFQYFIFIY